MIGASFDSTKTRLQELLARADGGKLQLPDFQRGWVWDDDRICSLLASVSVSFPIGAVMLLETGGESIRFKPRPLTGTHERLRQIAPETLILDGQQRLTSLYQALMSTVVVETKDAKGKPIQRWYYLDMKKAVAVDDDREEAVRSVPEDRQVKAFGGEITLDVTTPAREYAADLFPVNRIFRSADWRQAYNKHWNYAPEKIQLYDEFEREVIKRFEQYQVPVIELKKETPKEWNRTRTAISTSAAVREACGSPRKAQRNTSVPDSRTPSRSPGTREAAACLHRALLGLRVLDHVIVTRRSHFGQGHSLGCMR